MNGFRGEDAGLREGEGGEQGGKGGDEAEAADLNAEKILRRIIAEVAVPTAGFKAA